MQKLRKERGITLIALIITIIIMLILVGVTVSIALNGGLFTTAKEATNKTQVEIDKEQLLELALGAMNNKGEITPSEITKDGRFEYDEESKVYTSKSGNKFTVSKWGSVAEAPVYEISGVWTFNEWLTPATAESEGTYIKQDNISFTVIGDVLSWADDSWVTYTEEFDSIEIAYYNYMDYAFPIMMSFGDLSVYLDATGGFSSYDSPYLYMQTIDLGSTPQPVSKEFYDWFTANATKQS